MSDVPVIAIDGPTASGKGTIAQRVASALKFHYLDSGALYRLTAWRAIKAGVNPNDAPALSQLAETITPVFKYGRIWMDGLDVTDAIRTEEVSRLSSQIAVFGDVRRALLERQRSWRKAPGLVADGRDMGTVVFPDARPKIYLTASVDTRAARRHKQLIVKGFPANIAPLSGEDVRREVEARDQRDARRAESPLRPAEDAYQIDSSELGVDEVVALVLQWYAATQA